MLEFLTGIFGDFSSKHPVLFKFLKFNFAQNVSGIVGKLLTFLVMIFVARSLGPAVFGGYSTIVAFSGLLYAFTSTGLYEISIIEGAKDERWLSKNLGNAFVLQTYWSLAIFALGAAFALIFPSMLFNVPADLLGNFGLLAAIYLFTIVLVSAGNVASSVYYTRHKFYHLAGITLLERLVFVTCVAVFFFLGVIGGIKSLVFAFLVSSIVLFGGYLYFSKKWIDFSFIPRPDLKFAKEIYPKAKWFALLAILTLFSNNINTFLAQSLSRDTAESGYFFVAFGFANVLVYLLSALFWTTSMVSLRNNTRKYFIQLAKRIGVGVAGLSAAAIVGSLLSGIIISLAYGQKFVLASKSLSVLFFALPFYLVWLWGDQVLLAAGKNSQRVLVLCASIAANVVISFLLVPSMGSLGSAYAYLAGQIVMALVSVCLGYAVFLKLR